MNEKAKLIQKWRTIHEAHFVPDCDTFHSSELTPSMLGKCIAVMTHYCPMACKLSASLLVKVSTTEIGKAMREGSDFSVIIVVWVKCHHSLHKEWIWVLSEHLLKNLNEMLACNVDIIDFCYWVSILFGVILHYTEKKVSLLNYPKDHGGLFTYWLNFFIAMTSHDNRGCHCCPLEYFHDFRTYLSTRKISYNKICLKFIIHGEDCLVLYLCHQYKGFLPILICVQNPHVQFNP